MSKKVITYDGEQVEVTWDGRLCIHIGECGRASNELFVGGRDPWCQPDQVTADIARDVVLRCPTGALTFRSKSDDVEETAPDANTVHVSNNGPLYVTGDLKIEGAPDDMPGVRYRAALCRCGKSANKPFCDGAHEDGFIDRGAIGDHGEPLEVQGGELTIKPLPNGPLLIEGNVEMTAGSGRAAWSGTRCALCRCGASKNKPFCDGSHRKIGFEA